MLVFLLHLKKQNIVRHFEFLLSQFIGYVTTINMNIGVTLHKQFLLKLNIIS